MTRRTWFRWHSWLGLTAGLLLFVICWSGTIAVFSREIDLALDPAHSASPRTDRIAWGAFERSIAAEHPEWWLFQMTASHGPGTTLEAWAMDAEDVTWRIDGDPATGAIVRTRTLFSVQRFFRSFHMALFVEAWPILGVPLGDWIVALLSLPLLASMATALVFYRRFRRGFVHVQWRKGRKVLWSDVHKLAGVWSLWFVLAIGLTGLWYLAERHLPPGPEPPQAEASKDPGRLPIEELVARAQAAYPQLRINAVILRDFDRGTFEVHGQDGGALVRDRAARVWLDARSGAVLGVRRSSDLGAYQRWIETADPLHFGNFAGLWSKVPWFFFGLALSGLCLSGAYLQAKRQERRDRAGYRAPIVAAYAITIGCLLLAAAFGYREIMSYGSGSAAPAIPVGVTVFITAWTAATLAILTLWMRWVR
jgi:uncharacterized iron-regulated membrane protein